MESPPTRGRALAQHHRRSARQLRPCCLRGDCPAGRIVRGAVIILRCKRKADPRRASAHFVMGGWLHSAADTQVRYLNFEKETAVFRVRGT
jgi:hypothetical protein